MESSYAKSQKRLTMAISTRLLDEMYSRRSRGKTTLLTEFSFVLVVILILATNHSRGLGGILYPLIFIASLALSLVLTDVVKRATLHLGVLDYPSEARWHRQPVALLGGIAIFISFMLVSLLGVHLDREVFVILSGGGVIFALGLLDDVFGTRPRVKLTVQTLVAAGVAYFGVSCKILPYNWMNISLTVFWIVGITNALNLLDNMDGLSSGVTTIAAFVILALSLYKGHPGVALLCLALAGSCLGFLRYNFKPARIFMGDCGSLFLGYTLATLAILGGWQHHSPVTASLLSPILILSVPVFDTTLVTILRFAHGRMPWEGGKDHSSHRLVHILSGSEKGAVLILYGVGVLAGGLGLVAARFSSLMAVFIMTAFVLGMVILGIRLAKVEC